MIKNGSLTFMPQQTRRQKKELTRPVLSALQDVIDKMPITGMKTFLVMRPGKPYTTAGFGCWPRETGGMAGLKECTARSIDKIVAETLAENRANENQMVGILGWTKADLVADHSAKRTRRRSQAAPCTR